MSQKPWEPISVPVLARMMLVLCSLVGSISMAQDPIPGNDSTLARIQRDKDKFDWRLTWDFDGIEDTIRSWGRAG